MIAASEEYQQYLDSLQNELNRTYAIASEARKQGFDPADEVEIKIAKDVASRVEALVGPPGIAKVIRDMEATGLSREDIAFSLAAKITSGEIIKGNTEKLIEQAVRTSVGVLTEGMLVAPTEGISKIRIKTNPDGTNYVAVYFTGPIRSAGGTVAALAVALADYARKIAKIGDYRATDGEIERYAEEVNVYEARAAHLQYKPSDEDVKWIAKNCPVCIDGDPTEDAEVSVYRDLPRLETNRVRGGIPLVMCEGIAQKAAKVYKISKKFGLNWDWLEKLIKIKRREATVEIKPDFTYLEGLVAGRPVFAYPSEKGGFRLRYGKSRTNGLMAKNIHPAAMVLLDDFIAVGTHVKLERPGKGAVLSGCDMLEPPIARLKNGSVLKVRNAEQAREIRPQVDKILFLGDMLITYGDFLKSGHPLVPGAWCEEWWAEECRAKGVQPRKFGNAGEAFDFSRNYGIPLHPDCVYFWHDISAQQMRSLASWLAQGLPDFNAGKINLLELQVSQEKEILENLGVEHSVADGKIFLNGNDAHALLSTLGITLSSEGKLSVEKFEAHFDENKKPLELANEISGIEIKPKAPTYIGARMGRPEKAKERAMEGDVNVLFPTGSPKNRSILKVYKTTRGREGERSVYLELARFECPNCQNITPYRKCELCGTSTASQLTCPKCQKHTRPGQKEHFCDGAAAPTPVVPYEKRAVDLVNLIELLRKQYHFLPEDIRGVKGLSSRDKIPERLEKGLFRAKHEVYVFRDGTCRFDATDVPLTHFKPGEIGVGLEKLRELGYAKDYLGNPLESEEQIIPLKPQDIIISEYGAEYCTRVAKFIDDILVGIYNQPPFYKIEKRGDLLGHLFIGLSPHTSSGVLVRLIGFTKANVGFGHPYLHAARRRNCFAPETKIPVLDKHGWKLLSIKELVESNLANPQHDDFGTVYSRSSGIRTLAFNKTTHKFEIAEVSHVSRHAEAPTLSLSTKSGRKISVTSDHPFPTKNGKTHAAEATEVLLPLNINLPEKDVPGFTLADYAEDVMVKIPRDILKGHNKRHLARRYKMSYKTFTNYIYRRSYPIWLARDFVKENELRRCTISAKRDTVEIPFSIKCDDDFMFLLGAYLAEGHARKGRGNKTNYQLGFAASNQEIKKLFAEKIRAVFGIEPCVSECSATICSRLVYSFFLAMGTGKNARQKSVPSFVLSLPKRKKIAFLKGLFTGDGSVSLGNSLEVNLSSVSRKMLDEVSFILVQFGIRHSFSIKDDGNVKHAPIHKIRIFSAHAKNFVDEVGFAGWKQEKAEKLASEWGRKKRSEMTDRSGDAYFDKITAKVRKGKEAVYSLTVPPHHTVIANGIVSHQCDGDEDAIMLLLDALLNFSKHYLSEMRGGTMDTPITISTIIDPKEVDDEAHTMEVVFSYPLEFYRAAEKFAYPADVKLKTVKDMLGTPEQYDQLGLTHDTMRIDEGPLRTAYVSLKSIPEKIDLQFNLQKRLRPVNVKDTAERLILSHFIPDLYGNLRSFSRQTFRCTDCNEIYRRPPLAGKCIKCGGNLLLTINKGGIQKYLEISRKMANEYDLPNYLKQRLDLLEKEIESIFEDEKVKQMGIAEFM